MTTSEVRDSTLSALWYRSPSDAAIVQERLTGAGITEDTLEAFFATYDPRTPESISNDQFSHLSDDQQLLLLSEYAHRQGRLSELVADHRRSIITTLLATRSLSSIAGALGVTKQAVHKIARSTRVTR
ncbi:hypothetical protein [Jonesia denitrificans]|uniref:Uncharacterized protein n=1 Tax=Jonesia denitrificans (strain ATCC 14870 / DSM 20603 / BCRC 15368 / CIP 55.134 / JCM 11481 / NBRC 15587 / NCTC 10816 / Prevot 55134) TaxID=471856 RepID=C7R5F2_JONDD|nr:hypothetical protein [Jonesia denitrificans]ACV09225.1 hypothetical protein Jden_1577 [Jonesia denitrificans DSM 20603]QXB44049.1 hypothetical protein I6L70_04080 [Jonesia denitrificans]SQH21460.1 Uncharacterised protein [Jonesia denitrificans]